MNVNGHFLSMRGTRGISLVEIIAALGIISAAFLVALPLVLKSRESARLAGCSNNLMQLGKGVHAYLTQNGQFPPLFASSPSGRKLNYPLSWPTFILPSLDNTALYNSINFSFGAGDAANHNTLMPYKLQALICPSEDQTGIVYKGWTNYAANYGGPPSIEVYSGPIVPMAPSDRAAPGGYVNDNLGPLSAGKITDGMATTAMFSEKLIGVPTFLAISASSPYARRVAFAIPGVTRLDTHSFHEAMSLSQSCEKLPDTALSHPSYNPLTGSVWSGTSWRILRFNGYNHSVPPNNPSCFPDNGDTRYGVGHDGLNTAASNHPCGVNVCYCDGSVRFTHNNIHITTWWAMGTRNGAETLSRDPF